MKKARQDLHDIVRVKEEFYTCERSESAFGLLLEPERGVFDQTMRNKVPLGFKNRVFETFRKFAAKDILTKAKEFLENEKS